MITPDDVTEARVRELAREVFREEMAVRELARARSIGDTATKMEARLVAEGRDIDDLPVTKSLIEGMRDIERRRAGGPSIEQQQTAIRNPLPEHPFTRTEE